MLRALIFFILNGLNNIFNLNVKNKNILYITLCILLFINPNYIFNIGFRPKSLKDSALQIHGTIFVLSTL